MKKHLLGLFIIALALVSCKETGTMKVTSSGSIYELLVVMNNNPWEGAAGDSVRAYLGADMPCMPQMESYFSLMHTPVDAFDNALKSTRNILLVDINPNRYTQPRISFKTDPYAHPQAMAIVTGPDKAEIAEFLGENGNRIRTYFLRQELRRQADFYRSFCNHEASDLAMQKFGIDIKIPSDYQLIQQDKDFIWCCNNSGPKRRDLLIYSYPYTDPNTFTTAYLCQKRDEVVKRIEGYAEGTYVGTEYKQFPPVMQSISVNQGGYCAELRGLWRLYGPGAMGGPFVQHSRLDEINQRVITVETMLYAPGQKKRNAYRQAEAILYTLRLPQEINALQEISVSATSSEE